MVSKLTGPIEFKMAQSYVESAMKSNQQPTKDLRILFFYFTIYLLHNYLETNLINLCKLNKCLVLIELK